MSRVAAIALGAFLIAVVGAFLFAGPVVDYWRGRTADAEAGREQARDDVAGRALEVEGTEDLAAAADDLARAASEIRRETHVVEIRSRADPAVAAAGRLPPDELARMRAHDSLLLGRGLTPRDDGAATATVDPAVGP